MIDMLGGYGAGLVGNKIAAKSLRVGPCDLNRSGSGRLRFGHLRPLARAEGRPPRPPAGPTPSTAHRPTTQTPDMSRPTPLPKLAEEVITQNVQSWRVAISIPQMWKGMCNSRHTRANQSSRSPALLRARKQMGTRQVREDDCSEGPANARAHDTVKRRLSSSSDAELR